MKTTKKHFEIFKKECEKWINKLKLDDWEFNYHHENPSMEGADACVETNTIFRRVDIYLSIDQFDEETFNTDYIKHVAKHEILHVLLKNLNYLTHKRFITEDQIIQTEEQIIRKLEKLIK